MKPTANQIICGNNIDVVKSWPANCIDGLITDPPYGLGFMGKEWDTLIEKTRDSAGGFLRDGKSGSNPYAAARCRHGSDSTQMQEWHYQWAKAMLRITKPGGFLLCFGGTRTFHRLTCAIEDAGWEIRDCMMWLYGTGFPKSHDISKAIDKAAGARREVIGTRPVPGYARSEVEHGKQNRNKYKFEQTSNEPTTDLAQLWSGYGTALKPAWEPIIVAMKPLDGTFAHNAERHGVAGLNIDAARIGTETRYNQKAGNPTDKDTAAFHAIPNPHNYQGSECQGRWPANLILDEEAGAMLDEQAGTKKSGNLVGKYKGASGETACYGEYGYAEKNYNSNSGGASRFFYCAKTSRKERNMGMEDCEDKFLARSGGARQAEKQGKDEYIQKDHIGLNKISKVKNNHPTVKPLALMKHLCTLLKMPSAEQIILDPFLGSGTTGMACASLGIGFIGIEKESEYCEISAKRIAAISGNILPVTKNVETFRTATDFAGGNRRPNENLSHVSEHRQSVINAASAGLRRNRK